MKLTDLHPDSKLWIYSADRELTPTEIVWLNEQLSSFAKDWASHGSNLMAGAEVLSPYFVAFAVDLTHENASGCSIDKSVRLMKDLGKELRVDFFNRLKVWIETKNGHQLVNFRDLADYSSEMTYDILIDSLEKLEGEFKVSVTDYLKKKAMNV